MRALWLIPAAAMMFFHAQAHASGATTQTRNEPSHGGHSSGSPRTGSVGNRGNDWSTVGSFSPNRHRLENFHRYPATNYDYVTPAYDQEDDDTPDYAPPNYVQTGYSAPANYWPAPVAAHAAPPAPAVNVEYSTSEQPFKQPNRASAGAKVTTGTLYKYTHDGINTYTNIPPPTGSSAKKLFTYTEVDTPVAPLYR